MGNIDPALGESELQVSAFAPNTAARVYAEVVLLLAP